MKTLSLISDELKRFTDEGVTEEELSRAKEQAKSSRVKGLESSSSRMLKMGNAMTAMGYCLSADEILSRYDSVSRNDILTLARSRFDFSQLSLSALGKTAPAEEYIAALL